MSKGLKIGLSVLMSFICLTLLHVWLNIGFEKFGLISSKHATNSFRVGFLPVT
jgi:hypothetical protein